MPTTNTKRPFTEKDLRFWRQEIKLAREARTNAADAFGWKDNLERYQPYSATNGKTKGDINIGADFRDVERKKAALLYEFPDIGLSVKQDRELVDEQGQPIVANGQPFMLSTLVAWHADILNEILGPDHAHAEHAANKALFNCLCTSGVGPVMVGYQVTMRTEKQMTPVLDPLGNPILKPVPALEQAGAMMGLIPPPMPEPLMQEIEVEIPIDERWFVSDYSPLSLLIPATFKDTQFKKAPWMGREWRKPTSQVKREFQLPEDWTGNADTDSVEKPEFDNKADVERDDAGDPYVTGVDIYYRLQTRTSDEVHPDRLIKLVLADGKDTPLVHENCPYQTVDEAGELSVDSLRHFVDIPLVLRDLTDSAYVPADSSMTAQLTKEGTKYREQIITQRDGNKQVILYDSDKIDPTAKDKIVNANGVLWVPVIGGALGQGIDAIAKQVAQPTLGREQYMGMDVIDRDRDMILGIASNQTGAQAKGRKTATEQSIVQRNSEARFEKERQRVLAWIVEVASAIDVLVLRYADARIATKILGEVRGQLWAQHKHALMGCYSYDLKIDSGKYMDIEDNRRQLLQMYSMVRKDPMVNPRPMLKELALAFGYDPGEFVVEPQKPEKDFKASMSFKGEDFNPLNPNFAIVVAMARQAGWQIDEASVQLAQQQASAQGGGMMPASGVGPHPGQARPEHPGIQQQAPTISQHVVDESGDRSGPKVM